MKSKLKLPVNMFVPKAESAQFEMKVLLISLERKKTKKTKKKEIPNEAATI